MACHFNNYFTSIARSTVRNINPSNKCPARLITQNPNTFSFINNALTKKEIIDATKLLANKKNSGSHKNSDPQPWCIYSYRHTVYEICMYLRWGDFITKTGSYVQ